MSSLSSTSLKLLVRNQCKVFDLPEALVLAMIQVESSAEPLATRFEPKYRWLWDVQNHAPFRVSAREAQSVTPPKGFPSIPGISAATEWIHQKTSWGLMQVMGGVARELGFKGHLPELCDPLKGIEYGCRLLRRLADRHLEKHGWAGVVDAYNDGNPRVEFKRDYPHRVAAAGAAKYVKVA